jgi:hypothetical protein
MSFLKNIEMYRSSSFEFDLPLKKEDAYKIRLENPITRCNAPPNVLIWYDKESGVLFLGRSDWINNKEFNTDICYYKGAKRINNNVFTVKQNAINICELLNVKLTKTLFSKTIKEFIDEELKTYELFKLLQSKKL